MPDYPVGDTWWLANFLWGHRCIWNGDVALWPTPGVWQAICVDLDAIFWPGGNWNMLSSLLANASTVRLIGGSIGLDPLVFSHLPNGDTSRIGNAVGGCYGTTVLVDVTRYTQTRFAISHERGHALAQVHNLNTDPEVESYFGKRGPSEELAEAFARVLNGAGRSTEEVEFVRRTLASRGLA